jgi:hypothetical protein
MYDSSQVAGSLLPIARATIRRIGFFHTGTMNGLPKQRREEQEDDLFAEWEGRQERECRGRAQQGVLRSNCVDCLDRFLVVFLVCLFFVSQTISMFRTNAAQLCIGVAALGEQLYAMGLTARSVGVKYFSFFKQNKPNCLVRCLSFVPILSRSFLRSTKKWATQLQSSLASNNKK